VPNGKRLLSVVAIGYPAEAPRKARKPLETMVFTDEYGKR